MAIDAVTSSNSVANGFNAPINLQLIFNLTSLTADVVVAAFSQPKLNFGVDITQIEHYDVVLVVKLPLVSITKAAGYNASGFCDTTPGAPTTGASITGQWDIQLHVTEDTPSGGTKNPLLTEKLWAINQQPLFTE